ncbi:MAG: transcriptional repressor [Clostridia bacterium]|nr:transcriptional repressor [Clostridia bacterium]
MRSVRINYKTEMRKAALKFLTENIDTTVTAKDVLNYLVNKGVNVNITSVYRYLDTLCESGKLNKFVAQKGQLTVFQYVGENKCGEHLHLKCSDCGQLIHLDCDFMKEISEHLTKNHGFELDCENTVIYGKCDKCAKRTK